VWGGIVLCAPFSAGATPIVPQNGFNGTCAKDPNIAGFWNALSYDHRCSAGSLKSADRRPKSGMMAVHAQPDGSKLSNVTFKESPGLAPST